MLPASYLLPFNFLIYQAVKGGVNVPWLPDHPRKENPLMTAEQFEAWVQRVATAYGEDKLHSAVYHWEGDEEIRQTLMEEEYVFPSPGMDHWSRVTEPFLNVEFTLQTALVLIPYKGFVTYPCDPVTFIASPPQPNDSRFPGWKAYLEGLRHRPVVRNPDQFDFRVMGLG